MYDFAPGRAGENARAFLRDWRIKLVCDAHAGYKVRFGEGIAEIGCLAHVRRKFHDLYGANNSGLAVQALEYIAALYGIERDLNDLAD
ncbi:MAG: hypothetical protein CL542_12050 [Alcanivorax sp.]|nr:hypothetical protein [Alcanivorax sp.]